VTLPHHAGISTNVNAPPVAATEWNAIIDTLNALSVTSSILTICTSSTRPSSPATGRYIYETDTKKLAVYNGTAWVYQTPVTNPTYAWQNGTSNITLSSSSYTAIVSTTIADPGFSYYLECGGALITTFASAWSGTVPPLMNLQITLGTVTGTLVASTQDNAGGINFGGASYPSTLIPKTPGLLSGAQTVILSAESAGTGGVQTAPYSAFTGLQTYLNVRVIPA